MGDEDLRGKVVVITGASAGVGRATAQAFARRGCKLGLLARGRDRLDAAAREVERLGGRALPVPTDVADAAQVEAAAAIIERELGPIDVWINNAMTSVFAPLAEISSDEYARVTAVTYLGTVHGTMSALRRMLPRDRGTIVQVGSALAYRSIPLQSAYCGAKHAIRGFTDSLRSELLHDRRHIHLTMVQMPALNTDEPADPDRPDNLFAPVGGVEFGAHGRFDRRARRRCPELWLSTHRGSLALLLLLALAALAWALLAARGSARL